MISQIDNLKADPATRDLLGVVDRGPSLTDQVYEKLRHGLLMGVWSPGEKLTARKLSRDLGVSLTPAREAIMRLVNEGALDVSEKRTFSTVDLDCEQYKEVMRLRGALEPIAIELATPLFSDEEIKRLVDLNEQMKEMIGEERFNDALQIDSEFHLSICDRANQPFMRSIIDTLWLRAGPTRNRLSYSYRKRLIGYENHKRILAALQLRDAAAAAVAVARDLSEGAAAIVAVLNDDKPDA
ncbi:GntR family transcriptional regulator [Sneathiella sp. HT1-7]|jgi:DNA-binding GntR family transcriptional regulator|uniref:GntR family transcriptional regulator n=1 Tax=Sneathiella sp. HT1-7 TaxID=2887192 RepID=UPI001D14E66F|nr:GntR family transcriptional regulator [Sneathiella sp. HT1-7]MCC3305202.1 GntR family transcriptional regulator [Sneathiella sp. HT1-7]